MLLYAVQFNLSDEMPAAKRNKREPADLLPAGI